MEGIVVIVKVVLVGVISVVAILAAIFIIARVRKGGFGPGTKKARRKERREILY